MKTDKLLFGAACLAMGCLVHTTVKINDKIGESNVNRHVFETAPKIKPELAADTISFTECVQDTAKLIRKGVK
ncbi:MAG: hypothetical protein LUB59_04105 [Candidatus Gastranaerophilales bacterium]|nr:hypothetical protein [Candidatus Gastranaerophilales bacterium]